MGLCTVFPGRGADGDSVIPVGISCSHRFLEQFHNLTPIAQNLVTQAVMRANNGDTDYRLKNSYVRLSKDSKSGYDNLRAIEMTFGWRVVVAENNGYFNPVAVFRCHDDYDTFLDGLRRTRPQKQKKYPRPNDAQFDIPVDLTRIHIHQDAPLARLATTAMRSEGRIGQNDVPDFAKMARDYAYNEFAYPMLVETKIPGMSNIATIIIDDNPPAHPPEWMLAAQRRIEARERGLVLNA